MLGLYVGHIGIICGLDWGYIMAILALSFSRLFPQGSENSRWVISGPAVVFRVSCFGLRIQAAGAQRLGGEGLRVRGIWGLQ